VIKPGGAPICTLFAAIIFGAFIGSEGRYSFYFRPLLFLTLLISVGIFYDGTNVVNRYRYGQRGDAMLYDKSLVALDAALLSWLFPHGQLALTLDTNSYIGVTSTIGPYYAEALQIMYVSYYVWGNSLAVWFYYQYWRCADGRGKREQWRRIQMFLTAWTGTFMLTFVCNLLFPAVSPRIYLHKLYTNDIHGLFLCDILRAGLTVAAKGTYSAFPSGHCGLSWIAALVAYRARHVIPRVTVYMLSLFAALISLATLVMRYHYFVDFISAFALVAAGAWWGGFHTDNSYSANLLDADDASPSSNVIIKDKFEDAQPLVELVLQD